MVIIRDTTGITIKHTIDAMDHVRIGVTQTTLWKDRYRRSVRDNVKPHGEFTLYECQDLLDELGAKRCSGH